MFKVMCNVLLFILLSFVNYTSASIDIYSKTNLSLVKVLILQEDTVNIYRKEFFDNVDMCKINNLYINNYLISNTSNLKIVCKKHFFEYMLCERDLILLNFKTNQKKCNLIFSTFDNILKLSLQEINNVFKSYIFQLTFINCLKFFGLYFIVKLIVKILLQDNIDFTNNIYTR
jgi:hypothetical protein